MSEPGQFKSALKRSRSLTIAGRSALHGLSVVRGRLGNRDRDIGSTHRGMSLADSVAYVDAVFADYLAYSDVSRADLTGKQVLEVGPGDNFGVALLLLAAGAERVATVDRFATWRDPGQQRAIYRALLERMEGEERDRAERIVSLDGDPSFDAASLEVVEGLPIEEAPERFGRGAFDLIASRAVMEHVGDIDGAYVAMDELLAPAGAMAHKVDLSDHGLFTPGGHHPLTFLTVSDRAYRWMGGNAGLPNRRPGRDHIQALTALGYQPKALVTHLIDSPGEIVPHAADPDPSRLARAESLVEEIRPRLLDRYRDLAARDLAVAGLFLVGRR